MSQNMQILKALQAGDRITPIDALNRFGCFSLARRILDLKRMGHNIQCRIVKGANGKRWGEYHLEKDEANAEGIET